MIDQRIPRRLAGRASRVAGRTPRAGRGFLAGLLVLAVALGVLGWSVYEVWWRPAVDPMVAARAVAELRQTWAQEGDPLNSSGSGEAVAVVRIAALGGVEYPLLAGTEDPALSQGLGWYPGTAAPGDVGNVGVVGLGGMRGPLARLDTLADGAEIVVETGTAVYTYALRDDPGVAVVPVTDTWVIQPVPGQPEIAPTEAWLTLTTNAGLFDVENRIVAWFTLVATHEK
ncbi:MAG: sortase domain-bontaining protein [Propioniciclava sp.]